MDVQFGLKVFNTKGGYMEQRNDRGEIEKQHINSRYVDSDELIRFTGEKRYLATKEVCNILSTPYQSGWIEFTSVGQIKTDVDFTFVIDKPYPATILKIYAKAKILPYYKG